MKYIQKILIKLMFVVIVVLTAVVEFGCTHEEEKAQLLVWLGTSSAIAKEEFREKFSIEPVDGIFEIFGLLLIESKDGGSPAGPPMSVPHFALEVEHITRLDSVTTNSLISKGDKTEYAPLEWDVIHGSYQGRYGVADALQAFHHRRVRVVGKVYDLCGHGWYLQGMNDSDMACDTESAPDIGSEIELRNIEEVDLWAPN